MPGAAFRVVRAGMLASGASLWAMGAWPAHAQNAPVRAPGDYFLRPVIDGDPNRAPGFRPRAQPAVPVARLQQAPPQPLASEPPEQLSGTGVTGFNSTNIRGRKTTPPAAAARPARTAAARPDKAKPVAPARTAPAGRKLPPAANRTGGVTNPYDLLDPASVARRRPAPEDDPFAPTGVHLGAFLFKPAVELTGGYDTNPPRTSVPRGSTMYLIAPELLAQSLWTRHELTANLRGSYTGYGTLSAFNRPDFNGRINGRIDVTRDSRIDLEARTTIATESPGSPDLPTSLKSLPVNMSYGTTFGVGQRFNRFEVVAKGMLDRSVYGSGTLNNGTVVNYDDRNYDQIGGTLRGSYELTPGVKPFVEIGADRRTHDLNVDYNGVQRDSTGNTWRVGTTFELTRKLTGEISAGYLTRNYQDPSLAPLHGVIADAALIWSANALTTVKLKAASTAEESTLVGVSGVLKRSVGLEVEHAFRRWLTGTMKFSYGTEDYQGDGRLDHRYDLSTALTYKLSRTMQIKGEFRQEWLRSNVSGQDYTASAVLVGLRLQR